MANAYVNPDFDIDTDIDVAGLTALKGGAPALTDNIWIVNGATVDLNANVSLLQIFLGETSGGAAGAGQRYGHVQCLTAGVTITFGGAANADNSGIWSNPAGADASSANSTVRFEGVAGNLVALTNNGDAMNVARRWCMYMMYGAIIDTRYTSFRQMGVNALRVAPFVARTNRNHFMEYCEFTGLEANEELVALPAAGSPALPFTMTRCTYTMNAGINIDLLEYAASTVGGGLLHMDFAVVNGTGAAQGANTSASVANGETAYFRIDESNADFRPFYPGLIDPIIDGDATQAYVNGMQT